MCCKGSNERWKVVEGGGHTCGSSSVAFRFERAVGLKPGWLSPAWRRRAKTMRKMDDERSHERKLSWVVTREKADASRSSASCLVRGRVAP
jgi:hypothetical protein